MIRQKNELDRDFRHVVAVVLFFTLFVSAAESVHVGVLSCGDTIPIDSQFIFDPVWSLTPYRHKIRDTSGNNLEVHKEKFSKQARNVIKSESGMDPDSVTVFRLVPPAESSSSDSKNLTSCVVRINPLRAAMAGIRSTAVRFAFLGVYDSPNGACDGAVNVTVVVNGESGSTILSKTSSTSAFVQAISIGGDRHNEVDWPATLSFPLTCELNLLLLTDRHGRIDRWYTWIPTTVYTAVVTAFMVPAIFVPRHMPTALVGFVMILVYIGYLGSCIGLVVELLNWQSALGRMFPFPSAVTLYTCLCILYTLYLVPLVYRQKHYKIMLIGVLRILVYGLNCALCVGYWIAGFVVLGSLALFQYLATNFILTYYFAHVSVRLRKVTQNEGGIKFGYVFAFLWFAPVTPFAPCALLYHDLYLAARFGTMKKASDARLRDVVYLYNAQMSLPLLFFQNLYGVALVAAATAFHMPFIVALFMAALAWTLHLVYCIDMYVREWRRWHESGEVDFSSKCCGPVSLSPAMRYLLHKKDQNVSGGYIRDGVETGNGNWTIPPQPAERNAAAEQFGYADGPGTYADINSVYGRTPGRGSGIMSDRRRMTRGSVAYTEEDGEIYFPPAPPDSGIVNTPLEETLEPPLPSYQPQQLPATPLDQRLESAEYWPTDVQK